jgi:plasmid stability protein
MTPMSQTMTVRPLPLRPVAAALLMLAAAGCSARDEVRNTRSLEAFASSSSAPAFEAAPAPARELPASAALLRLPAGTETAVSVGERREGGRRVQEIALARREGGERNRLLLTLHGGRAAAGERPSEAGIRAELTDAFSGESPRVLTQPRHNGFGPYGLALVAGPGARRCVYAWQWLDGADARVRGRLGGDASWRGLICRDDATLDQIAGGFDRLDIGRASRGETKPAPARRPATARAAERPATQGPILTPERHQPAPQAAYGSGRYLAPVTALPPGAAQAAGQAAPALDASLPAEAYRGPTTRSATGAPARVIALHGRAPSPTD